MNRRVEYKDVTQERMQSIMRQRVNAALNRVDTWLVHPSFDTKKAILEVLTSTRFAAEVMHEAATGERILKAWSFDVPWVMWSDLIVAIQSGDKGAQRQALYRLRKSMADGPA